MDLSVLIVDDHDDFRGFARRLFEAAGLSVVGEAGDGATAVAEAHRLRPQVVVLDIGLPDSDGIDVARKLTEKGTGPAVVLVSARDASTYGARLLTCGARGFIPKAQLSVPRLTALLEKAP
jgi:DNA-binding NarL/FixJ family response regulator